MSPWNRKDYPDNWEDIVARIKHRAGNRCEGSPAFPDCRLLNGSVIRREKDGHVREPSAVEWQMIYDKIRLAGINFAASVKLHGFTRVVLTIGHVNHDKENHDVRDEDLKAWCQKCHLNFDKIHHSESRKYGRNHKKNNLKLDI